VHINMTVYVSVTIWALRLRGPVLFWKEKHKDKLITVNNVLFIYKQLLLGSFF
jgi:hypothetical protein